MKNFEQPGDALELTAPYARNSGEGALIGAIFGVAVDNVASGARGVFWTEGVFSLAKATGAISEGAKVWWDNTNRVITTTATGNQAVGVAVAAAASGDATVRVKIGHIPPNVGA